jgi:hypothetical protein
MATLEDVRRFVRQQDNLTPEELEQRLASRFDMSRDEAARMLRGLSDEDPSLEPNQPGLLTGTLVAAGLAGTTSPGGTQNAPGAAALLITEAEEPARETREDTPRRDD